MHWLDPTVCMSRPQPCTSQRESPGNPAAARLVQGTESFQERCSAIATKSPCGLVPWPNQFLLQAHLQCLHAHTYPQHTGGALGGA